MPSFGLCLGFVHVACPPLAVSGPVVIQSDNAAGPLTRLQFEAPSSSI